MSLLSKLHKKNDTIFAVADGAVIRLENLSDQAFANQMVGDGLAIETHNETIYAPCEGTVTMIAPTKHAFTITTENGTEILVHIGLQHNLQAKHFQYHVNINDRVDLNKPIVTLLEEVSEFYKNGIIIVLVVLNHQQHPIQTRITSNAITRGKKLFTCR